MAFNFSPKIVTDNLVLYLDAANPNSYPGSGTTWSDLSPNNRNLTLVASPTYTNSTFAFNGTSQYTYVTDSTIKNYTTITATIWLKVNAVAGWDSYFSYNSEQAGLTQGWGVRNAYILTDSFQYWGGTGNTGIKLYINGALAGTSNSTVANVGGNIFNTWQMITLVATGVSSWNTTNTLSIATRDDNLGVAVVNGSVGTFSLYNRELSATEVAQNYNALKSRFGL